MSRFYLFASLIVSLFLASLHLKAQDTIEINNKTPKVKLIDSVSSNDIEDNDSLIHRKSHFMASLTYLNNNVYLGRRDSVATPYLTPTFGYYHKSGLYISGSASYLALANE